MTVLAYLPDEAIGRKFNELTGREYKLFTYFCQRADKETGECYPGVDLIAADLGWQKSHVYETRRSLVARGWITLKGDRVKIRFGFPRPKNEPRNGTRPNPEMGPPDPNMGQIRSRNGTPLPWSEPDQLTSKPEPHTRTASPRGDHGAQDIPRVCVNGVSGDSVPYARRGQTFGQPEAAGQTSGRRKSRFSLAICREYAAHLHDTGQGITNPNGWGTTIHRSGNEDEAIEAWIEAGKRSPRKESGYERLLRKYAKPRTGSA